MATRCSSLITFAKVCDLLEAVELRLAGLFLNAGKALAISILCETYEGRGSQANIPRNRLSDDDTSLDSSFRINSSLHNKMQGAKAGELA